MTKKEFKANLAYLENEGVYVSDEPVWDYAPNSRELFFATNCGGDFSICVEEVTRAEVLEYLHDYDVSEAVSMWWQSGRTPFTDIKDLYEDIDEWKQNFIKIAEGMPY